MTKTARAHTNIALIKYWGKADPILRLPLMSSLSLTLDAFYTDTSLRKTSGPNQFFLNGQEQRGPAKSRVCKYLRRLQARIGAHDHLIVTSCNHVPTAAGLASSSSAFAALAGAFNDLYDLHLDKKELSRWARVGSGSACRSIYGGFVLWHKGRDDRTSYAQAIEAQPKMDLQLLALEVNQKPKKISSTAGMQQAQSSPFFAPWLRRNPKEIRAMIAAIQANDFTKLGSLAELNANEMHAVNLTACPPFTYFEPATIKAIRLVESLRAHGTECYYTIDAGPNVKILTRLKNLKDIEKNFLSEFDNAKIVKASFGPGLAYLD